jgi:two-component system, sensor histidine kinase and response regulator
MNIELAINKQKVSVFLKEINKTKDKFFSIIAHDLRNPVIGLYKSSEIILANKKELSKDDLVNYISEIHNTTKNLYELTENLLEWSRINSDKISFSPLNFKPKYAADQVIKLLQANIRLKNLQVINNIEESFEVHADLNMVITILLYYLI